jgi:cytoskeletal protein RodZ
VVKKKLRKTGRKNLSKVLSEKSSKNKSNDLSNKVVFSMLIIVVVISVLSLGLYVYTSNIENSSTTPAQNTLSTEPIHKGEITLEIVPAPKNE